MVMSALINVNILHTPQAKMIGRQYGLSINIRIYSYTASCIFLIITTINLLLIMSI